MSLFLQNFGQLKFTIVPNERTVASGAMVERGKDPKTVRLATPITLAADATYIVRVKKADAPADASGTNRTIVAPPGTYAAQSDIAIESGIGRSETRDARFELLKVANHPPLQLPFGAMPAAMPALFHDRVIAGHTFVSQTKYGPLEKPVRIMLLDLIIVGTAVGLMVLLQLLVYKTPVGTAMAR